MTGPAHWWAVDLHVHTPGSQDAHDADYGTPADIVAAAVAAGIDAIAVTDHNTAAWCDAVADAAADANLIVLPGAEISTPEGHLLAVWEEGTASSVINEVLVVLGIRSQDRGKLDIVANEGLAASARHIVEAGGMAIAAHIDKPRGLLTSVSVAAHQKRTLEDTFLAAVEIVDLATREKVDGKLGGARPMAFVQGSDTWDTSLSRHALSGIGARRTWVKASRADLIGISHALADPELRVRLGTAPPVVAYPVVQSVEIVGGFLGGQLVTFCPDLNCLLGGTGAGKSLVLEAIRYALDQQVDASAFPAIHNEVQSRLRAAVGAGIVKLQVAAEGYLYRIERPFSVNGNAQPTVYQEMNGEWAAINAKPATLIKLAAFSQGEVLEYSRRPVGRMSLIDADIDISTPLAEMADLKGKAVVNASKLLAARGRVANLREKAAKEAEIDKQVQQLAALFDTEVVKQQEGWTKESSKLTKVGETVDALEAPSMKVPAPPSPHDVAGSEDLFSRATAALKALKTRLDAAASEITAAISEASQAIETVRSDWQTRYKDFQSRLDAELEKVDGQSSLTSLRLHLGSLQQMLAETKAAKEELAQDAIPDLQDLEATREELLSSLARARRVRRELRRSRVTELNQRTAGFVRLDVPDEGDFEDYRKALDAIKVGSRVREEFLTRSLSTPTRSGSHGLCGRETSPL